MARLSLVILAIFVYVAVSQGKKWKSCERRIQRFERCLEKGYKSKAGCVSGEGTLKKRSWKTCRRLENKIARKCNYVCEKPAETPPAVPWLDTSCLEEGVKYNIAMESENGNSFEQCAYMCNDLSWCKAFSSGDSYCSFHTKAMELGREDIRDKADGFWSMNIDCGAHSPAKSVPGLDTSCLEEGIEYNNGPVQYIGSTYSFEECANRCQSSGSCRAFSSNEEQCYLHEKAMEQGRKDIRVESFGFWSMNIDCGSL